MISILKSNASAETTMKTTYERLKMLHVMESQLMDKSSSMKHTLEGIMM